jgi:hypothetical protein
MNSEEILKLDYWAFDQGPEGWRSISEFTDASNADCLVAGILCEEYCAKQTDLSAENRSMLAFHAGQNFAFGEAYVNATLNFEQSFRENQDDWNAYVMATIAFIKKDKSALLKERAKLAAIDGQQNLNVVDRLIERFNETYKAAYLARIPVEGSRKGG